MPPSYQYMIIELGSKSTKVQFNSVAQLHDTLPNNVLVFPSFVYRDSENKYHGGESAEDEDPKAKSMTKIEFMKSGKIVDINAFNFFVKIVYKSILRYSLSNDTTGSISESALNVHLLLVSSTNLPASLSKFELQQSINYLYENVNHLKSLTFLSNGLSLLFAYGANSLNTCLVVDVGYDKFSVQPIVDFLPVDAASFTVEIGGQSINKSLQNLLPNFTESQIEEFKKSDIYEILSRFLLKKYDKANGDDEDQIDVLKIVNSDKPKELLDSRKAANNKKQGSKTEEDKLNHEREFNYFVDSSGNKFKIGRERFSGCDELLQEIQYYVNYSINKVQDNEKRAMLWSNIILNGRSCTIKGFKEKLLDLLESNYGINSVDDDDTQANPEAKFRSNAVRAGAGSAQNFVQPSAKIDFVKKPEYFPNWKEEEMPLQTTQDLVLMGAVVFTKLCFGPGTHHTTINNIGNDLYVIRKEDFQEHGPNLVWELNHN